MPPDDPSSPPQRFYRPSDDLARDLNLRTDQIVRARVVSTLEKQDDRVILSLKGKRVVARTGLDVSRGQPLIVRVESTDHPIELKVFEQQQAVEELSREDWSRYVEDLGHRASGDLLDLIPELVDRHLALSSDLLKNVADQLEYLRSDDGVSPDHKLDALSYLVHRDVPVHTETLRILAGGREAPGGDSGSSAWDALVEETRPTPVGAMDYRNFVRGLGIDYVNQIGRWPRRASRSLHGRLLGEFQSGEEASPPRRALLARLLRLGLRNRLEPGFVLPLPWREGERVRTGTVAVKGDEPSEPGHWTVDGFFPFARAGDVQAQIRCRGGTVHVEFRAGDERTRRRLRRGIDDLRESLRGKGLEATIVVTDGEPRRETGPDPGPGTPSSPVSPGGVDFQV